MQIAQGARRRQNVDYHLMEKLLSMHHYLHHGIKITQLHATNFFEILSS